MRMKLRSHNEVELMPGMKVRFRPDTWVAISNDGLDISGMTGTITSLEIELAVVLDKKVSMLDGWNNEVIFVPEAQGDFVQSAEWAAERLEVIV